MHAFKGGMYMFRIPFKSTQDFLEINGGVL